MEFDFEHLLLKKVFCFSSPYGTSNGPTFAQDILKNLVENEEKITRVSGRFVYCFYIQYKVVYTHLHLVNTLLDRMYFKRGLFNIASDYDINNSDKNIAVDEVSKERVKQSDNSVILLIFPLC